MTSPSASNAMAMATAKPTPLVVLRFLPLRGHRYCPYGAYHGQPRQYWGR